MAKTKNTLEEFRDVMKAYKFKQDCRDYDNGWRKNIYSPNKSKDRIRNGEAQIKRDVVFSAWKNYCRESFIYRVLEFFRLR
jgi:hypothetical protein